MVAIASATLSARTSTVVPNEFGASFRPSRISSLGVDSVFCVLPTCAETSETKDLIERAKRADSAHDPARAEDLYTRALQMTLSTEDRAELSARLAHLYLRRGHLKDAQPLTETALNLAQELKKSGKLKDDMAVALDWLREDSAAIGLAELVCVKGQEVEPDRLARNDIQIAQLMNKKRGLGSAYCGLARAQIVMGKFKDAVESLGQAVKVLETSQEAGAESDLITAGLQQGVQLVRIGKTKEGWAQIESSKKRAMRTGSEAQALARLGSAQLYGNQPEQALTTYLQALQKIDKKDPTASKQEAQIQCDIAFVYHVLHKPQLEEASYRRAYFLADQKNVDDDGTRIFALKRLAPLLKSEKKDAEAEKALAMLQRVKEHAHSNNTTSKWLMEEENDYAKKGKKVDDGRLKEQ